MYLEEHPSETKELIMRCLTAQRAREAARLAREETHRKRIGDFDRHDRRNSLAHVVA